MRRGLFFLPFYLFTFLLFGCRVGIPEGYTESQTLPKVYPDVIDVTVPVNIAPLTFTIEEEGTDFVTRITADGQEFLYAGRDEHMKISYVSATGISVIMT